MLVEASLSRVSAGIGTEVWEENSNAVLVRRHYFILARDAWGIAPPNTHAWLKMVQLFLRQGYEHSSENCYI